MTVSLVKNAGKPTTLQIGDSTITLRKNSNITKLAADIIVNASKESLKNGGGLNKAIHSAGGNEIDKACMKFPAKKGVRCPTGQTRMTGSGNLPASIVCHTVAPDARKVDMKKAKSLLADAYRNTLRESHKYLKSLVKNTKAHDVYGISKAQVDTLKQKMNNGQAITISFPTLGTGIFKFPKEKAMKIALKEIVSYVNHYQGKTGIKNFNIVFFPNQKDVAHYEGGLIHYSKKNG